MPDLRRLQERLPVLVHIGDQGLTTHTGCRLKKRKRGERIDISGHTAGLSQQRRIAIKAELVRYVLPFALFDCLLLGNADGVLNADGGHMRELALKRGGSRIIDFVGEGDAIEVKSKEIGDHSTDTGRVH